MRRFLPMMLLLAAALSLRVVAEEAPAPAADPGPAVAEHAAGPGVEAIYVVRTGQRLQAPSTPTYRLFEFAQQRGRWIVPDMGYYDIGRFRSQLWFAGAGVELHPSPKVTWTQIVYVAQAAGRATHNERMLWIWPVVDVQLAPRLTAEAVVYPTIPLDKAQRWALDVDRAKMEYHVRPRLMAGVGINASTGAGAGWLRQPFLTATMTRGGASWEMWGERIPGGAEVQLRYQLVRRGAF